ncbi:MAG: dTDP-4-dehydrorhamnose 3,5-epimerase [Hyphomonadaceae bacterium]|nr:dTDP-4-dehydrorhamnose 3,5-epimerase [Hyphomonadaceae bacterium]
MRIERASIADILLIQPKKHGDSRGFFSETFRVAAMKDAGVDVDWVQDNHSLSQARGVVRGLHFQRAPKAQAKLLRVVRGAILDVAVDVRKNSPTYGEHVAVELSADNWTQLYVPVGFAHGFCTLTENCEVLYKVSAEYGPAEEGGLLWNDADLAIDWPIAPEEATLSVRDREWPRLRDIVSPF